METDMKRVLILLLLVLVAGCAEPNGDQGPLDAKYECPKCEWGIHDIDIERCPNPDCDYIFYSNLMPQHPQSKSYLSRPVRPHWRDGRALNERPSSGFKWPRPTSFSEWAAVVLVVLVFGFVVVGVANEYFDWF
jgi:hypothetical protein